MNPTLDGAVFGVAVTALEYDPVPTSLTAAPL